MTSAPGGLAQQLVGVGARRAGALEPGHHAGQFVGSPLARDLATFQARCSGNGWA